MTRTTPFILDLEGTVSEAIRISRRTPLAGYANKVYKHAAGFYLLIPIAAAAGVVTEYARWNIIGGGTDTYEVQACHAVAASSPYNTLIAELVPNGVDRFPPSILEMAWNMLNGGVKQDVGGSVGHGNVTLVSVAVTVDGVDRSSMTNGQEYSGTRIEISQVDSIIADDTAAAFGAVASLAMSHTAYGGAMTVYSGMTTLKQLNTTGFFYPGMLPAVRYSELLGGAVFDTVRFFDRARTVLSLGASTPTAIGGLYAAGAEFYRAGFDYVLSGVMPDWFLILNNLNQNQTNKVWVHDNPGGATGEDFTYAKLYMHDLETGAERGHPPGDVIESRMSYIVTKAA